MAGVSLTGGSENKVQNWLYVAEARGALENYVHDSSSAFVMAGYHEGENLDTPLNIVRDFMSPGRDRVFHEQQRYLRDKEELQSKIDAYKKDPRHADTGVAFFSDMLDQVGTIKNTREALGAINAWVNNYVAYDTPESQAASGTDDQHRSMFAALRDHRGVCDEQARLKLFAVETLIERKQIDLKPGDVRWVAEAVYENRKIQKDGHAVVAVHIPDDSTWVLNNQTTAPALELTMGEMDQRMSSAATLLSDTANANFLRSDSLHIDLGGAKNPVFVPVFDYNSQRASYYNSGDINNPPKEATDPSRVKIFTAGDYKTVDGKVALNVLEASAFSHCKLIQPDHAPPALASRAGHEAGKSYRQTMPAQASPKENADAKQAPAAAVENRVPAASHNKTAAKQERKPSVLAVPG